MPTERCAKLMVVGMANNLDELWISNNPMLLMTYANQYFPTVFKWYEFSVPIMEVYLTTRQHLKDM